MTCTAYSCQVTSSADPSESSRNKLTKDAVVDRALALADATGLDALTIRKLAQDLGVTPMALYWHFRGKNELLAGLADRVWSEIDTEVDRSAPWPDQLRTMLESLVRVLRAHPAAAQILMSSNKESEAALPVIEATLEVLRGAGFDPLHASTIAHFGLWTGVMLVMSEPGIGPQQAARQTPEERAEAQRRSQVALAMLPVATYPRLVECAAPMTACDDPEFHYDFGVSLFIAGVEAMAASGPSGE